MVFNDQTGSHSTSHTISGATRTRQREGVNLEDATLVDHALIAQWASGFAVPAVDSLPFRVSAIRVLPLSGHAILFDTRQAYPLHMLDYLTGNAISTGRAITMAHNQSLATFPGKAPVVVDGGVYLVTVMPATVARNEDNHGIGTYP
jgi:hypothetical protein